MELITPTPEQGSIGLRALWSVATVDGEASPEERSMLDAAAQLSGATVDLDALTGIEPDELAESLPDDGQLRWQLVCALVLMSMVDAEPSAEESQLVGRYAKALAVDNDMVGTLHKLTTKQLRRARLDIYRRFWGREHIVKKVKREGFSGLSEVVRALRRKNENTELNERYRGLAELPPGTLGREYFEFISANEFSFPGELGHGPEIIAQHDLAHVLGGFGASSTEEMCVAFFCAGFRRENPMTFVLLGMFQLHLGVATMPGQPVHRRSLDMAPCLEALRRGAAMSLDLSGEWDFWSVIDQPVAKLREAYGIPPRTVFGER